jgi:GT2 family glycosyltransferase
MVIPANPFVSVVIPTLNRDRPLCMTLEYFLLRERYYPFEVIVIDQSDWHDQPTAEFLEKITGRINYVRVPYKSLTRARNHGVQLANGEIIVFVDDDTEPYDGFLAGHIAPFQNDQVWLVTGPVLSPGQNLVGREELEPTRYARVVGGSELCEQANFDYAPCAWAPGCNFSARKSAIERVGGFDELFYGVSFGEDSDFSHRVKMAGGTIFYSAAAALTHHVAQSGGCRDAPSVGYVYAYASNLNHFWRKIGAGWRKQLCENWLAYRQLVLNRRVLNDWSLRSAYLLHRAFLAGAIQGLRQPIVPGLD